MKLLKKSDWMLLAVIVMSFVPGLILYNQLPAQVPSHWNIYNQVDRYSSKNFLVFFVPGINLILYPLFLLIPKIDPRRDNYNYFSKTYAIVRWAIHLFMIALLWINLIAAVRMDQGKTTLDFSFFMPIVLALLMMVLGNYMGRIRHNYTMGIRTPWTLASEQVWQKTHRLAGKVYVLAGIVTLFGLFFSSIFRFIFIIGPILIGNLYLVFYSYWEFRKTNLIKE